MITRIFHMKKYSGLAQNSLLSSTSVLLQRHRQCFMTTSANSTTSNKESDGARKPTDSTIDQETTNENLKQQQEEPSNDNNNKKNNNNTTTTAGTTTEEKKTNQQESVGVAVDPEQLVEQIQQKEQEIARLREVSLRAYAEMENVRKIAQRDVENARKYSIGAFAKDLLEVADNLERALQNIPSEKLDPEKGDAIVIGLYEGVKATNDVLHKVFQRYGIEKYDPMGEKFDPNLHQAMFQVPDESNNSGVVLAVAKTGYKIQDRVLRPAQVGVSKAVGKDQT
ncbi:hypothetical protein GAYE_SCF7681MG7050 [Galdieria yellowstonensis]|uniref:GrpE protein homolog n=1 Tax=Galdieria yellowstonensis TaxID=3028027 RepID=A0AAV9INP1_9RHOD|nr:hypothetical protein GAYE_SCF7681MG7050 [Galdieria yellowstonensis]